MLAARIAFVGIFACLGVTVLATALVTGSPFAWLGVLPCAAGAHAGQRAAHAFFTPVPHQDRTGTVTNARTVILWSLSTLVLLAATLGSLALAGR